MFIKTHNGTLVNLDKVIKIDITSVGNGALDLYGLRAWFDDSQIVILFGGKKDEVEIAQDNLEEAILTNAKILSYHNYKQGVVEH